MVKIEAVIQPFKLDDVKAALDGLGVERITIVAVTEHGRSVSQKGVYRGAEYLVDVPRVKLEMFVSSLRVDEVIEAGPEKVGRSFYEASLRQKESGGTPLEKGAELCVYLASEAANGITGKLISAVWDPWPQFEEHRTDLEQTDIYTLRRIVPRDRGMAWG